MLWLAQPSVFVKPFPCFNLRSVATYPRSVHLPIWNHQPGASGIGYAHLLWLIFQGNSIICCLCDFSLLKSCLILLFISQESMYLIPGRSDLFCSDISCLGTGFEGSALFTPVVALSAKFWLGHLLCLI